jgi:glutathione-regulated potassium-efflux system protein KefB
MLFNAFIYLCAAVISVPIAKRLGLGSVLGYLFAGILIGPYVLQWVGEQEDVMHFAEFGVVIMLFLIGLELRLGRLWELRKSILGLGGLQVVITLGLITMLLSAGNLLPWREAIAIGMAVALSSTAIVIQSLTEKGLLKTQAGTNVFSVLLFQDIAVIPILALLPLLAIQGADTVNAGGHGSLVDSLPIWAQVIAISLAIVVIVVGGSYLSRPVFRYVAETHQSEIFTALALLIVVATTLLMQSLGLSPALGSFLAGVVLAENEFRHEIEINMAPFKGLLLGLFFITVGASIDFSLLVAQPLLILALMVSLISVKALVLALLARLFSMGYQQGMLFTLALAQGGEFAFVIASSARLFSVIEESTADILTLVVALSMLVSPLLLVAYETLFRKSSIQSSSTEDTIEDESPDIILAGYGRFGQIIGRLLTAQGFRITILDHSPSQIEMVRRFGNRVYYGDASRPDLLEAAGAREAKLLVIAIDEHDRSLDVIKTARRHFPHLKLAVRAIDRRHTYELMHLNVDCIRRETFHSALKLGIDSLKLMGINDTSAERAGKLFEELDYENLKKLSQLWGDDVSYGLATRQGIEDLKQVLQADRLAVDPALVANEAAKETVEKPG